MATNDANGTNLTAESLGANVGTVLRALADRCEREEPSRDLDVDIQCVLREGAPMAESRKVCMRDGYDPEESVWPKLTTSLDAAVSLVPEGWVWVLDACGYPRPAAFVVGDPDDASNKDADAMVESQTTTTQTPALAMCAAALRARAYVLEKAAEDAELPDEQREEAPTT